jgi:2'-5' RNA ligase
MNHVRERSVRVFFALWPSEKERAALAAWQPELRNLCGGRVMRAPTLHATLAFLGEVVSHRMGALQLAAQEVAGVPFELVFDLACYWGHNHIVYASPCAVPPELERLAHDLRACLIRHRFHFDKQPFNAHVTLLRHAKWGNGPLPAMRPVMWHMRDFALVQSSPDESGAHYEVLARFPLNGA